MRKSNKIFYKGYNYRYKKTLTLESRKHVLKKMGG